MGRKPRTFRQDPEVQEYLDGLPYGDATDAINDAIRNHAISDSASKPEPAPGEVPASNGVAQGEKLVAPAPESDKDFQGEEAFRPPTQQTSTPEKPLNSFENSEPGKTLSGDPETSAPVTTSKSEGKPSTPKPLTSFLRSADTEPRSSSK